MKFCSIFLPLLFFNFYSNILLASDCSTVELNFNTIANNNQKKYGSCYAHAGTTALEYFLQRNVGQQFDQQIDNTLSISRAYIGLISSVNSDSGTTSMNPEHGGNSCDSINAAIKQQLACSSNDVFEHDYKYYRKVQDILLVLFAYYLPHVESRIAMKIPPAAKLPFFNASQLRVLDRFFFQVALNYPLEFFASYREDTNIFTDVAYKKTSVLANVINQSLKETYFDTEQMELIIRLHSAYQKIRNIMPSVLEIKPFSILYESLFQVVLNDDLSKLKIPFISLLESKCKKILFPSLKAKNYKCISYFQTSSLVNRGTKWYNSEGSKVISLNQMIHDIHTTLDAKLQSPVIGLPMSILMKQDQLSFHAITIIGRKMINNKCNFKIRDSLKDFFPFYHNYITFDKNSSDYWIPEDKFRSEGLSLYLIQAISHKKNELLK